MIRCSLSFLVSFLTVFVSQVYADHAINVERAAAEGRYLDALAAYDKLSRSGITTNAKLAAARSAWGLSLMDRSKSTYLIVAEDRSSATAERAEAFLSLAVIEYQEHQLERSFNLLGRYKQICKDTQCGGTEAASLLEADIEIERGAFRRATEVLTPLALNESSGHRYEALFRRAKCYEQLHELELAQADLVEIPIRSLDAPRAMRLLAEISVERGSLEQAAQVLTRARDEYPTEFLDSWVDYVLVEAAAENNQQAQLKSLREEASKKFPPSEPWLQLLNAGAEAAEWRRGGPQS